MGVIRQLSHTTRTRTREHEIAKLKEMDDVNINEISIHLDEIKLDADTDEWIKLSWTNRQNDTNEEAPEIPDTQKECLDNETLETQTKDNNNEISTNVESEDISDGISVISESDVEDVGINPSQTCQLNDKTTFKKRRRYIIEETMKTTIACLFGVMAGFLLHMMSMYYIIPPNQFLSKISNETLITTSHNIVNTYKELAEVKAILSEIEVYTKATNYEISVKDRLTQVFKSINSSKMDNESIIESLDSNLHPLNQLQLFLYLLSPSLIKIDDINNLPKYKMNKTLDIVNNVKEFYETLILFKNGTQNVNNFTTIKFLQNTADKIHNTSQLLLFDLLEKINKITLNIYNKYAKLVHKLREKLCYLKNTLPDNNGFLKQLTENNQLFENYDKSCFSNYSSQNLSDKTVKRNTKKNNMKNRILRNPEKLDDPVLYAKHDETNISKVYNNNSFLKSESNKAQDIKSSTAKNAKIANDKIDYTSELSLSEKILPESMSEIIQNMNDKYNKESDTSTKEWCHLENIFDEELLKLSKNNKENNKNLINWCERISDILKSIGVQEKDILKNSFNKLLIQDPCIPSHANNYCSENNIDMSISDIVLKDKTKDFVVTSDKKHINIATTVTDDESFAPILLITEKDGLKKKDSVKSNAPTNTIFDNNNANVEINNTIQKNTKRHVSQEEVISYRKPKSSFNTRDTQQNNQHYIGKNSRKKRFFEKILLQDHADWYFLRSNSRKTARKNMNTNYKLDWYFQRAHSRKNARKYIKYQQNTKFRRKHP
ncbi:uncharacterized protein LOC105284875 isoform X2 [Ooceraea biroi]|uniref:uncharacterized protein LOC105284875 isoform X2 n=1 Tax=Ooceraea biroi TaxID=2015173 RepID=UPI000F08EA1D|nr:uncharacterized protein LOC105284875 isoform X2 [Ooceraea biroi]